MGALPATVKLYEPPAPAPATVAAPDRDVPMAGVPTGVGSETSSPARPLQSLPLTSLKTEIQRLEKYLLDLPAEAFHSLRGQLETNLAQCKLELRLRLPQGQTLDQAQARLRQTPKARLAATEELDQARQTVVAAEATLQQAVQAEEQTQLELNRVKALISDADAPRETAPPPLSPATVAAVYMSLQQAGWSQTTLDNLARSLQPSAAPAPALPPGPASSAAPALASVPPVPAVDSTLRNHVQNAAEDGPPRVARPLPPHAPPT